MNILLTWFTIVVIVMCIWTLTSGIPSRRWLTYKRYLTLHYCGWSRQVTNLVDFFQKGICRYKFQQEEIKILTQNEKRGIKQETINTICYMINLFQIPNIEAKFLGFRIFFPQNYYWNLIEYVHSART